MSLFEGHKRGGPSALPEYAGSRRNENLLDMASDVRDTKIVEVVHLLSGVDVCIWCSAVVHAVICCFEHNGCSRRSIGVYGDVEQICGIVS